MVDYLCIGSQYTNASYGINPELTLSGNMKSLGNFGGYITYYYENPLTDNPKNKYGIDFYVIGNSQENNIDSMAEAGQVYVSEDGEKWYPIAGSEHYEDTTITDYTITYYKTTDGKSEWKDSLGNKISYSPKAWPSESYYSFNGTEYTFTGVLLKCQDGTVTGGGTTADYAAKTRFGYPDYYASNISGLTVNDVNPYVESPSKSNGIDLAWAVDENGMPIDIDSMDIHYVKIATASNIHAGSFAEKSTEVTYVVRTSEQSDEVGKTNGISGIVISDGASSKTVSFDGKTEISADIGDMKYIGISVIGASGEDNIYVNSRRISCNEAADGFKVVQGKSTIIRIIVQNGEKEPAIYHITLNGNAQETNRLIEGVKINVSGTIRAASTKNETDYTLSVGHRISEISVIPTIAPGLDYTVNSDEPCESYALEYGDNTFEITSGNETVTLTVTRNDPPASADNNISVYFILYGDSIHDEETKHIFRNDIDTMPIWIPRTRYIVPEGSTALDVFEKALTAAGLSWVNAGGNYICEIDGLCEFDNGPLSGWMYTVNGSYPELGVSEMELHTGDTVLFHYTDNFTLERSGDKWNGTASWNDAKDNDSNEKEPKKEDDISEKEPQENEDISDKEKEEEFIMPFKDIPEGEWYFEAVEYASRNGLMNGVSETEFAPHLPTTRAMLVTILFRLEETEKEYKNSIFSDVKDGLWYTDAVNWAAENGIVNGISDTLFDPDSPITREQTAVMLYRYAQYKKLDTAESKTISSFEDSSDVSVWAKSAMEWAYASELINGMSETVLAPREGASRAQTATMLMRFIENTDTEE